MNRIKTVNIVFLITVLISIAGSFGAMLVPDGVPLLIYSQVLLVCPAVLYLLLSKQSPIEALRIHKIKFVVIILLIILTFLLMPLLTFVNALSMLFFTNSISGTISDIASTTPFFISLTTIAFVPCILEESVYRGIFYNEYRKVSVLKGIVLSGLLFGLLHMNFNQFLYAFLMGIIFALVIEATDSIVSTMIMHFAINGSSVTLTYAMTKLDGILLESQPDQLFTPNTGFMKQQLLLTVLMYGFIAIFTTALAVLLYIAIAKISGRWEIVRGYFKSNNNSIIREIEKKQRLITIPLIIAVIICIILMIYTEIVMRLL